MSDTRVHCWRWPVLAGVIVVAAMVPSAARCGAPGSLSEMLEFAAFSRVKPWTTQQASGYDRGGGFYDSGNFLRVEPGPRYVLLDAMGPGVIDRMWFTYKREFGMEKYNLLVYLDNASEPVILANLDELFADGRAPFVAPLAGLCGNPKHPGRYSYVPIGFETACRVMLEPTGPPDSYSYRTNSFGETIPHVYYQITWRQLPAESPVRPFSWTLDAAEQAALRELIRLGRDEHAGLSPWPVAASGAVPVTKLAVSVHPGEKTLLAQYPEPGTIIGLRLHTQHPESLRLEFHWDDDPDPSVSADFGPFFAGSDHGSPRVDPRGTWIGSREGTYYCYLPMPFHQSARLFALSTGDRPIQVTGEIDCLPGSPHVDQGRLHVHRYDHPSPTQGEDYVVLDTRGRGHFVGLVMDRPGDMEGDDRFFVDGESAPSLHGTGTEDFFNFAWGLSHTGSYPWHGITIQGTGPAAYRFHLPAGVPFRESLRIDWEHGHDPQRGPNLDPRRYSGVVFYYLLASGR